MYVRGVKWIPISVVHVPFILPNEHVTGEVLLHPGTSVEIHSLDPFPVGILVSDFAGPDLRAVARTNIHHVELLPEEESISGMLVGRGGCHLHV